MKVKQLMFEVYHRGQLIGTAQNKGRWTFLEEYKERTQESFDATEIEFKLVTR